MAFQTEFEFTLPKGYMDREPKMSSSPGTVFSLSWYADSDWSKYVS